MENQLQRPAWSVAAVAFALLAAVTFVDWWANPGTSLGVLYVLPMLPAATSFGRWQIIAFALVVAACRSSLLISPSGLDSAMRFLLSFVANAAAGLFVAELTRRRKLEREHSAQLAEQERLRQEVEEHLRVLASSSPAAILTLDEDGRILSANESACELLGFPPPLDLKGMAIHNYLPLLADALKLDPGPHRFRTALQCQGRRESGEPFIAQIWFSVYRTNHGRRLAAIAVDSSEETREREEENLRRLHENNRIIAAAVSHEIRNVCGAITLVHSNLRRSGALGDSEDAAALAALVNGLEKIASADLESRVRKTAAVIDPREVLSQLRIVIEPSWVDILGRTTWKVPPQLPMVYGDAFGLLQALLNLTQNSLRAVERHHVKELTVTAQVANDRLQIILEDTGPGLPSGTAPFKPFQPGADHVGLGLFVSRAMLRSYSGDLRYEPQGSRCRFVAELQLAPVAEREASGRKAS
jgi:two-component system, LuxR family, sensor kinase FixL